MATESLVFDILARDGASPSFAKVGAAAQEAAGSVKDLSAKLKDVAGKSAEARVGITGDKEANAELDRLDAKMITLGRRIASPNIKLDGILRARADLTGVELALDKINGKHAKATVEVSTRGSFLSRLGTFFGGAGGGAGGAFSSLFGLGGAASSAGSSQAGSAAGATGQALGPFGAIGAGGGIAAAILAGLATGPALIPTALGTGIGGLGALLAFPKGLKQMMANVVSTLRQAAAPLKDVFRDIFAGFNNFIKSEGPQLRDLFKAAAPFLAAFFKILEQAAKTILPAITQSLRLMAPNLPLLVKGFAQLSLGVANLIKSFGPQGMKAATEILVGLLKLLGDTLTITGHVANWFAQVLVQEAKAIHTTFDNVRHDIATWGNDIAKFFITLKNQIVSDWNATWADTIGATIRGIRTVTGWFQGLPRSIRNALAGLGKMMFGLATGALDNFLAGLKSVWGGIWSWLKGIFGGLAKAIGSLIGQSPPHPGSAFWELGADMMRHLEGGIKSRVKNVQGAFSGAVSGNFGAMTGNAAVAQSFAASILPRGWSMSDLVALWNRESGWNAWAVNPSSGAYGIPQSLGHGHPYNLGDYKAQIIWGLNYIASAYGNSQNAWAHEMAFGWYDKGGFLPPGLSLAYNATGRPEQVIPAGHGATTTIVVHVAPSVAAVTPDRTLGQHIGQHITAAIKGGMALYPAGISPR